MTTKRYSRMIFVVFVLAATVSAALFFLCSCTSSGAFSRASDGHVILNCSFDYLKTGESKRYYAKQSPAAANYSLVWASSDESVATVDDGFVTAVSGGETVIRVSVEGKPYRAEMKLTVADETVGEKDGKNGLQSALNRVKNNGVVLITDGYFDSVKVDKRVAVKGCRNAAVAGFEVADDAQLFIQSVAVYATSVSGENACVRVGENASFTAVGCTFFYDDPSGESRSPSAVFAPSDAASVYCRACSFSGYSECIEAGATDGEIYIVNNDFSDAETAVDIDMRRAGGEEDGKATGRIADNVYIGCGECVRLLFNALSYTGTLEIPDSDVSVPR